MTTGLLVIDLQCGMFDQTEKPHDGEAVLARTAGLLARARTQDVPIFHIRHDGGLGDPLAWNTPGFEIHPAVAPRDGEPVIDKTITSAFRDTDLHEHLQACGIARLVLAGMQTEFCIDTNCRTAYGLGYAVTLAGDAHTTFDTPALSAAQIVAHHNRTLSRAGLVALREAASISFTDDA